MHPNVAMLAEQAEAKIRHTNQSLRVVLPRPPVVLIPVGTLTARLSTFTAAPIPSTDRALCPVAYIGLADGRGGTGQARLSDGEASRN